ncbi:hypothetical protein Thert_00851 [Thermoanaerobacterium thermosaccharolyticum]|uniref:Uncharacterized protein n=1 Tax=Thermoanaerobacterium thermosaccharolyticum TaxID=1517 RepID=A0A223HX28_THETR|nr:hypothetical protein Thert_00851 [Thermoanaerobacterium thermosaccharolyticum]
MHHFLEFEKNIILGNLKEISIDVCKEKVIFTVCSTGE